MKAITLWQPWATIVAAQAKRFETRGWTTTYRGPLAIHAAARRDALQQILGEDPPSETEALVAVLQRLGLTSIDRFPFGAVVCTCELADCVPAPWAEPTLDEEAVGDFTPGRFAWRLDNVRPLDEPIAAVGKQGFWEWTPPNEPAAALAGGLFD